MNGQNWRAWAAGLLGAGVLMQLPAILNTITGLDDLSYLPLLYLLGNIVFWVSFVATIVALALAAAGARRGALASTIVALAAGVAAVLVYMVGDLRMGIPVVSILRGQLLGLFDDYETGGLVLWPSAFLAGLPLWAVLAAALVVLLRAPSTVSARQASFYAGYDAYPVYGSAPAPYGAATMSVPAATAAPADPDAAPAGWYPNPTGAGPDMYWDGQQWITETAEPTPQTWGDQYVSHAVTQDETPDRSGLRVATLSVLGVALVTELPLLLGIIGDLRYLSVPMLLASALLLAGVAATVATVVLVAQRSLQHARTAAIAALALMVVGHVLHYWYWRGLPIVPLVTIGLLVAALVLVIRAAAPAAQPGPTAVAAAGGVGSAYASLAAAPPATGEAGWYPSPTTPGQSMYWNGQQWLAPAGGMLPQTSGTAIAAIITVFLFWPAGLVLGYVARKEIRQSGGTKTGSGMAMAAIVLGWISLGFAVLFIGLVVAAAMSSSRY